MHDLFNVKYIQELCREYDFFPSKQYGQHYLVSKTPIKKMIEAAELKSNDTVVEIGPGFGVLTSAVAPKVKRVIAFEIEGKLRPYWKKKCLEYPNVDVVWGNAMREVQAHSAEFGGRYIVLANLPYQITSATLRMLLELPRKPERIVVMVQKEVAERVCAEAGDMNLLGLSVQYYGIPRIVCHVPGGAFWPIPKVDSAVLAITPKDLGPNTRGADDQFFFSVARAGFSQKRKQLWNNIAHGVHLGEKEVKAAVAATAGNEKARAEDLGIRQWKILVKKLENSLSS